MKETIKLQEMDKSLEMKRRKTEATVSSSDPSRKRKTEPEPPQDDMNIDAIIADIHNVRTHIIISNHIDSQTKGDESKQQYNYK